VVSLCRTRRLKDRKLSPIFQMAPKRCRGSVDVILSMQREFKGRKHDFASLHLFVSCSAVSYFIKLIFLKVFQQQQIASNSNTLSRDIHLSHAHKYLTSLSFLIRSMFHYLQISFRSHFVLYITILVYILNIIYYYKLRI